MLIRLVCHAFYVWQSKLSISSMLVTLRDQGLPLPSGAILISPWVDLTHSFPSVSGTNEFDYIPSHGFLQRPSAAWPPPNADDMKELVRSAIGNLVDADMPRKSTQHERQNAVDVAVRGFSVNEHPGGPKSSKSNPNEEKRDMDQAGERMPGLGHNLSIMIDNQMVEIKDQIQMYASNQLISHPLVSPVLQPSLGGLPPLLILTGGGNRPCRANEKHSINIYPQVRCLEMSKYTSHTKLPTLQSIHLAKLFSTNTQKPRAC